MSKQPYIPFYVGDWLKEPGLAMCCLATRGFWVDAICNLHVLDHGGQITGTPEQFSRLCRCTVVDAHAAIADLQNHRVADVIEREGVYTLICRRMKREAERKQKYRENASKGGSKTASKREAVPEYDNEVEGLKKIVDFIKTLGLPESDGAALFHKWEGNGWTNGGKPIRDWKATIRSWAAAGYLPSQKNPRNTANGSSRQMSVFEIEKRIEAINGRVNAIYREGREEWDEEKRRDVKVFTTAQKAELEQLKTSKELLKKQMLLA